jgi:pimeloyl-ACP methyl ester carboxylesterase
MGLSMGGYIAADFALSWPHRVEALVLVGPGISGAPVDSPELAAYVEELTAAAEADDFQGMIETFTRYWCDGPHRTPEEVEPAVRSKVLEMLGGSRERWEHYGLERQLDPPAWDRVSTIQARTLVILGTIDMPDIHRVVAHLAQEMPNVQQVDIPGVAHMVNMEAPQRFNEVTLAFLQGG